MLVRTGGVGSHRDDNHPARVQGDLDRADLDGHRRLHACSGFLSALDDRSKSTFRNALEALQAFVFVRHRP